MHQDQLIELRFTFSFAKKKNVLLQTEKGQFKDAPSLNVICFEPIFKKAMILSNLQDVALIQIEKDVGTHKPRGG